MDVDAQTLETRSGQKTSIVMIPELKKILIIQTAFAGDVILTLPMIQVLKRHFPNASIDAVVIPRVLDLLANNPHIDRVISYDKRKSDKGLAGFFRLVQRLRLGKYDLAIVPHRSLRSALLAGLSNIPHRIGFDRSAGRIFFTERVRYDPNKHEVERNYSLLQPLGIGPPEKELPKLYPSFRDGEEVDRLFRPYDAEGEKPRICIAPGTVWKTKQWLPERFAEVAKKLAEKNTVILIGGKEDEDICEEICRSAGKTGCLNFAGKLSLLQSAEVIKRCKLLLSNDSAPMHIAVAMGTPVVAIFGATVPEFGFAPYGPKDIVVETRGLPCRPCSIHGGKKCPIKTFVCMRSIESQEILSILEEKTMGSFPKDER